MNRNTLISMLLTLSGFTVTVSAQTAEDASAACLEAVQLIEDEDFQGALDEAKWCVESLQQIKQQRTLTVFPDEVEGFVAGELENESAMGMTILKRSYQRDGEEIEVSLTTGVAGGGLAALAQLGMGMGAGAGKKMRIQKRTVIDMTEPGGSGEYMVQLKSGGMLMVSSDAVDTEGVLGFLKKFPIKELDEALEP